MPLKPFKYGIKLYALCKARSGYACSITLHSNKRKESNIEMINRLTNNFKNKNNHIYMDNFYTSVKFFENLKETGIYCCGTLRENRGGHKKCKSLINSFSKGDGILKNNGNINYLCFKDNGVVQMISNIHSGSFINNQEVNNTEAQNMKQNEIIINYNNFMGGVDLMDQILSYYSIDKKSQKWTIKLVFHLLSIVVHNSYILYKKNTLLSKSYLQYLIIIMENLSRGFNSSNIAENINIQGTNENLSSNKLDHYPIKLEKKQKCARCKKIFQPGDPKYRKTTSFGCVCSNVPLCIIDCFNLWHNEQDND